jgi:hypothetical protein
MKKLKKCFLLLAFLLFTSILGYSQSSDMQIKHLDITLSEEFLFSSLDAEVKDFMADGVLTSNEELVLINKKIVIINTQLEAKNLEVFYPKEIERKEFLDNLKIVLLERKEEIE